MESREQGGFHETVDTIKRGHLEAAKASLREGAMRDELIQEIEWDCENLRGFLQAAQVSSDHPVGDLTNISRSLTKSRPEAKILSSALASGWLARLSPLL